MSASNFLCKLGHAGIHKLFPHILRGKIVGMDEVFGVKAIVSQIINDQFIRREIMEFFKFVDEVVHCVYKGCLAPVIFHDTLPQMADRADSKNYS